MNRWLITFLSLPLQDEYFEAYRKQEEYDAALARSAELAAQLQTKEQELQTKDQQLQQTEELLKGRDEIIEGQDKLIQDKEEFIASQSQILDERDAALQAAVLDVQPLDLEGNRPHSDLYLLPQVVMSLDEMLELVPN